MPIADTRIRKKHIVLEGEIPSALNLPPGCPFQTRCHRKIGRICETEAPPLRELRRRATRSSATCRRTQLLAMEPVIAMPTRRAGCRRVALRVDRGAGASLARGSGMAARRGGRIAWTSIRWPA